jgi:hypothetical protein
LDANGSHGQAGRFLEAFVRHLGIPWDQADCAGASVRIEVPTHRIAAWNRRIDVLVRSGRKDKAIAIENKPSAADQPDQVTDYLAHLEAQFPGPGRHCLVYLSRDGSAPSERSIGTGARDAELKAGRLHVTGYEALLPWLQQCCGACRADRVTFFLGEFSRYIEQRFAGVRDVMEREQMVAQITGSAEMLAAALQVVHAGTDLKRHLLKDLERQVDTAVKAHPGWQFATNLDKPWPGFSIRYSQDAGFRFQLEAPDMRFRGVYFGVKVDQKNGARDAAFADKLAAILREAFGKAGGSNGWCWCRNVAPEDELLPVEPDWSVSAQPWLMIQNGELANGLIVATERVREALSAKGIAV